MPCSINLMHNNNGEIIKLHTLSFIRCESNSSIETNIHCVVLNVPFAYLIHTFSCILRIIKFYVNFLWILKLDGI